MPSLLMQCSKIAGEPKNVGSRLEVQVFGSRAEIVHWQASLVVSSQKFADRLETSDVRLA